MAPRKGDAILFFPLHNPKPNPDANPNPLYGDAYLTAAEKRRRRRRKQIPTPDHDMVHGGCRVRGDGEKWVVQQWFLSA